MRLEKMLNEIKNANTLQVDYLLDAVIKRKRELYPDWEIFYCAAEKAKISSPEDMIRAAWEFEKRIREKYGR